MPLAAPPPSAAAPLGRRARVGRRRRRARPRLPRCRLVAAGVRRRRLRARLAHRTLAWGAARWSASSFGASFYLIHIEWITRYLGVVPWFALAGARDRSSWRLGAIPIALAYRWMPRVLPVPVGAADRCCRSSSAGCGRARELLLGTWPYTGFPWGRIGMSQSESPLAHIVSWIGVAGLTFLMVAFTRRRDRMGADGAVARHPHRAAGARPRGAAARRPRVPDDGSG